VQQLGFVFSGSSFSVARSSGATFKWGDGRTVETIGAPPIIQHGSSRAVFQQQQEESWQLFIDDANEAMEIHASSQYKAWCSRG
jgi:hypothetical protein